jgi:hypothetical protein
MSKVNFIGGTQALYDAIAQKDPNSLYFISDTQRIYKGDVEFTQNVYPVVNFPEIGIEKKIYIHKNTLEVKVYEAGEWLVVLPGYIKTVDNMADSANGGKLATIDAIKDYVDTVLDARVEALFKSVEWDNEDGKLLFAGADPKTVVGEAQLEGVAHDASFDSTNLRITIPQYGKDDLVIDIPKDNFLEDAYYDKAYDFEDGTVGPAIVLVVKTDGTDESKKIAVPASAMTNDYTAGKTDTIQVTIDDTHKIKARLLIDANTSDGVLMIWDNDGKKAGTVGVKIDNDTSTEMGESNEKVPTAAVIAAAIKKAVGELAGSLLPEGNEKEIVISTVNGIVRSGKIIGGATLSDSPNADTLATEAAVLDAISWKTLA